MYDLALVQEILGQIRWSTQTIQKRFEPINSAQDFLISDEGLEKLDAICMQLIALGESVKNLERVTGGTLLPQYPDIEWKKVMGMRDIVSHHYFDVDAEVVHSVCTRQIPELGNLVEQMIQDLSHVHDVEVGEE